MSSPYAVLKLEMNKKNAFAAAALPWTLLGEFTALVKAPSWIT